MIKKHRLLIVLASLFFICQVAFSKSYECGDSIKEIGSYLELDKDQLKKIDPILKKLKKIIHDRAIKIRGLNKEINEKIASELMDENNMKRLIDRKSKLITEVIKLKVKTSHKIYIFLRKKQKVKYQKLMEHCHANVAFD
jgi:Spy/CpxP family protein refolding chaperone